MYENIKGIVDEIIINEFGKEMTQTIIFTDIEYESFNEIPGNVDNIELRLKKTFADEFKNFIDENDADVVIDELDKIVTVLDNNYGKWPININENYFGSTSQFSIVRNRVMKIMNNKLLENNNICL